MEEVKKVSYLRYRLKMNEGQEKERVHVKERVKKTGVMGQIWEIGKRKFGGN